MGGSSKQTIGYKYFSNFLLFIGNPIEKLLNINFDKRGWIADERISYKSNGEMIYIEKPNLYGENEGGVYGTMRVKHGTNNQTVSVQYKKYMASLGLPASAYPYQSYVVFGGGGFPQGSQGLTEDELENLGDSLEGESKYYEQGFYLGNSGYMKEMLLCPQRIHMRNDGRQQWYDEKAEINPTVFSSSLTSKYKYHVQDGFSSLAQLANFASVDFDDSSWGIGQSPFGYVTGSGLPQPNTYVGPRSGRAIMIRENITVTDPALIGTLKIEMQHDDGGVLYWNGEQIPLSVDSYYISYAEIPASKIKAGVNTLFCAAVDSVPAGSPSGIYLYLKYENAGGAVSFSDLNPIHKIREILTDDTAMHKPESDVNDTNFKKAADVLFREKLGISWSVTEKSCLEAINEICGHIEAGVRMNRQTGLYEMVLFRDDWFSDEEIHTLPVNKIKGMQLDPPISADELINKLNVSFYNRDAIKDSSFSIAENASIRNLGGSVNAEDAKFPYFMNQRNAAVVAQWKLKQMSSAGWSGSFTTAAYEARKWNRYDLLKLAWPRKWTGTILVRIMKINLGTGTDVSIDFVEVVPYSSELSSNIVIDTPVETTPKPPLPALFKTFELSYFEAVQLNGQKAVDEALAYNPDAGYAAVIAKRPQNNSLNALMYTDIGSDYEREGAIAYSETAELDQSISKTGTAFIVKQAGDIDMVSIGTQITINNEIMVYESYDEETGLLTVKRGALDTIPQNHLAGGVLYFADDFVTVDTTEYVTGEIINVKALTTTPSGILSLDDVDAQQVEIQARAIRPYPPANVKINDEYWPAEIETDLVLTWVDRNRVQQTGGSILGWFDSGVTIEPNTQTHLILTQLDENNLELATTNANLTGTTSYTMPISLMQADARFVEVILKTVRDGYECLNPFVHKIELSQFFSAPYDLVIEFRNDETNRLELNWKLDGFIDEQRYYCSESPIDPENLPIPKAFLTADMRTYIDTVVESGKTYYVAVGSVKNLVEKLSDIKVFVPKIYHVLLEFDVSGIVKKGTSSANFINSGGVTTQMQDGSYAMRLSSANTYLYSNTGDAVSGDVEIEMIFTPLAWPESFGAWYDSRESAGWAVNGQILGFNSGNAYIEFRNGSATWAGGSLSTSLHALNKKTKATFRRVGNVWKYYIDDMFVSNLSIVDPFLSNIMQNQIFIGRVKDGNSGYHLNGYLHRWSIRKL